MAPLKTGTIVVFGDDGLGVVEDVDGLRFGFHSTAIADGSRSIAVGADVNFAVYAGHGGETEATTIVVAS